MRKKKLIEIPNAKGYMLNAYLELPANQKPSHFAIFAHCFSCNSNFTAVRNISGALTNHGFGVLRFDFTGLGRSEGSFSESHFSSNVNDLICVHNYLKTHFKAPKLLVGHSLGGAAAIVAASQLIDIEAVAIIGSPSSIEHIRRLFVYDNNNTASDGEFDVNIGGRPFKITNEFLEELTKTDLGAVVENLNKPILIMHSPTDSVVGIDNAQTIYRRAQHPKSFISLDGADHLLTNRNDSVYIGNIIGTWTNRYIPKRENEMLDTSGEQLVGHLNLMEDDFTTFIQSKNHFFIADEPIGIGDDFGPSPYEYLTAALAACTTMTLKLFAQRKGWKLHEVFVYITHSKKHSDDLMIDVTEPGYLDHISIQLKVVGDLDEMQKMRLLEIAHKCPVHKTLSRGSHFNVSMIS